jgi:hypothetical protein
VGKAKEAASGAYKAADDKAGGRISSTVDKTGEVASGAVEKAKGVVGGGDDADAGGGEPAVVDTASEGAEAAADGATDPPGAP